MPPLAEVTAAMEGVATCVLSRRRRRRPGAGDGTGRAHRRYRLGQEYVSTILAEAGRRRHRRRRAGAEVVARRTPGLDAVVAEFGDEVRTAEGELDRPAMGVVAFATPRAQAAGGDHHPLVYGAAPSSRPAGARRGGGARYPAARRGGPRTCFDAVVVVDAPVEVQVVRMERDRGWSREEAEAWIAAQANREDRLRSRRTSRQHRHARGPAAQGRAGLRRAAARG